MSKQDKVQVKLIFEGDTLKVLQDICEEECRSITQQVQYIVKKHLKDDLNKLKHTDTKEIKQIVEDTIDEEAKLTLEKYIEPKEEKIEQVDEHQIDDDILNF